MLRTSGSHILRFMGRRNLLNTPKYCSVSECCLLQRSVCPPPTNSRDCLFGDGPLYTHYCGLFKPFIVVEGGSFFSLTTQFSLLLDMVCCYRLMIAITLTSLLLLRVCNRRRKKSVHIVLLSCLKLETYYCCSSTTAIKYDF